MANNQKDVKIAITAENRTQRGVTEAKTALDRFAQAQQNTAKYRGLIDQQRATAAAAKAAAVEIRKAGLAASNEQVKGFRAATAEARKASAALDQYRRTAAGVSTSGPRGSFAAFDQMASGVRQADVAVEALAADLPRLAAAQERVVGATNRATAALRNQAKQGDLASRITGAAATRNQRGPLGLRPYELQNLGYQVNDLVTQIASGTPVMQAFAQQGGQIAQIFPGAIAGIVRFIPLVGGLVAVLGTAYAAFKRIADLKGSQDQFATSLIATGDAGAYNAEGLALTARALDEYSGSLDEARDSVKAFMAEGVDESYFDDFGKAARNAAKVLGLEIPDASKKVATAFTGTYDDVKELDDAFQFLTVAERKQIREMFESGKAAEARTEAFRIFDERMQAGADKMNGPWSQAVNNIANAWRGFLDWLGSTAFIQGAIRLVDDLARKIQWLTSLLPGANGAAGAATRITEIDTQIQNLSSGTGNSRLRDNLIRNLLAERSRLAAQVAAAQETANAADPRANNGVNQKQDEDAALERQAKLQERLNALAKQRAEELARQRERQAEFLEDLQAESDEREFQIDLLDQSERQQAILTALREAQTSAEDVGLTLTTDQLAAIRQSVAALYDAEAAAEGRLKVDQLALEVAKERGEIETRDAYISRMAREAGFAHIVEMNEATGELVSTMTAEEQAYRRLLGQQYDAAEAVRQREAAEKAVNDQMALRTSLMESIEFYEGEGEDVKAAALREQLIGVNAELLKAIDSQIALLSTFTGPEFETALANLRRMRDQIAATGQQGVVTGQQINEGIAGVGVSAFDGLAKAIAEGTNAWDGFRDAFLQAASDFLREIARMILQQAILNALGGGSGSPNGGVGGGIAGFINGLFRHDGGMVGSGGGFRPAPAAAFNAQTLRYHVGGVAGLKPGEIPAVLKRGEVVDPGDGSVAGQVFGSGQAPVNLKNVNLFNPAELLSAALADEDGQKVLVNFIGDNSRRVQGALGR